MFAFGNRFNAALQCQITSGRCVHATELQRVGAEELAVDEGVHEDESGSNATSRHKQLTVGCFGDSFGQG